MTGALAGGSARESARAHRWGLALPLLVAIPFLFAGLGHAPFDDPGEGMHAEIARELWLSGDPLTLNGVRYVDKPPLLYVLLAGAFALGGPSEGSARAVPAVAALGAVAATAWLGARLIGAGGGVLAGGALLTSVGFFAYGRYVRPETLFVAALAGGFALVLLGLTDARRSMVALGLGLFGVAGLAKDPLGALAPPLAVGLAMAASGRGRPLRRWLPLGGTVALLVLGLGWWVVAELRTPGTAWYTVIDNHVLNVARARHFPDEDVPLGALAFLGVAGAGAFPWIIAAAATVADLVRTRAWRDPEQMPWVALALWALGVLGVTALSSFRLPHYGLPAYPALALLAARGWQRGHPRTLIAVHAVVFAALAAASLAAWRSDGTVFTSTVLESTDVATRKSSAAGQGAPLPPWGALRPLLGTTGLVLGAGALALVAAGLRGGAHGRWHRALPAGVVVTVMLALMPCVAVGLAQVSSHRGVRSVGLQIARGAAPGDLIAHEGPLENSGALEWYSRRRPVIVEGRRSVLGFGATLAESRDVFWEGAQLRAAWEDGRRIWVVTTRAPGRTLLEELPGAQLIGATGGHWLYVNR